VVIVGEEEDEPRRAHHDDAMGEEDGVSLGSVHSEAQGDAVRGCGRAGGRAGPEMGQQVLFSAYVNALFLGQSRARMTANPTAKTARQMVRLDWLDAAEMLTPAA
jgi:hypothetical protein